MVLASGVSRALEVKVRGDHFQGQPTPLVSKELSALGRVPGGLGTAPETQVIRKNERVPEGYPTPGQIQATA